MSLIHNKNSSGNVLFLILIAVALFAALSFAVSRSNNSGGKDITSEKAKLLAAQMIQYATDVEEAILRLQLINGCDSREISFWDPTTSPAHSGYYFKLTPYTSECNVYDVDNVGGIKPQHPPLEIKSAELQAIGSAFAMLYVPLRIYINDVGTNFQNATDYATSDLVLVTQMSSREVCMAINDFSGVENTGGEPPTIAHNYLFTSASTIVAVGQTGPGTAYNTLSIDELDGKYTGCVKNTIDGVHLAYSPRYSFYHVLVAE